MTASSGAAWGARKDARLSTALWSAARVPPLAVDAVDDRGYRRGRLETLGLSEEVPRQTGRKAAAKEARSVVHRRAPIRGDRQGGDGTQPRQARPRAKSALRRAQALGPDRAAGDGRRRQGRHDQTRLQRPQSARRACRELQAAERARARA